jgi:type II secretory pathway component GspD/PulD (secretin)
MYTMPKMPTTLLRLTSSLALAGILLMLGCALHKAQTDFSAGNYDDAVQTYREILSKDPNNVEARIGYRRAAMRASEQHLKNAKIAEREGHDDVVEKEVREAYRLDPSNAAAQDWIARLEAKRLKLQADLDSQDSLEKKRQVGEAKSAILLNPRSLEGMDLNFTHKTSLKDILTAISRNSGVSILFHSSYQDASVSADLRGLSFQRILDTLMLQSDLFYKVIDTNTIMVFKNTPQNREQYENQLIKTFYLSDANVDDVRGIFQTLMPQLRVFVDKRLNAVTIKAKPTDLTIARRIVSQLDKAKAEVMIYIELLEVTENSLEQVGLLPVLGATDGLGGGSGIYRIGATVDNTGSANVSTGGFGITKATTRFLFPSLALDALKSNGDAKLVASPNVRVISGETGEVNIGEKISTTQSSLSIPGTATTSGTTASAISSLTSQTQYSYEDVGVKIKVVPRVHFNDDITLQIESSVTTLKSGSTPGRPDLGKREIKTITRLQDGETAVFGGLLKEEEQKSLQGVWGLTDIPILGKLFGNNYKNTAKTDVILTIRAVLVRKPDLREEDFEAFDPDLATSQTGPFMPRAAKGQPAGAVTATPAPASPAALASPAPVSPAPVAPIPAAAAPAPMVPAPTPDTVAPTPTPQQPEPAPAAAESTNQDLVLFMTPLSTTVSKSEHIQLTLMVSGGKGLSSGSVDVRLDPKLKLVSAAAGDFLTNEKGSLTQNVNSDGTVKLTFQRPTTESDSGSLAMIELEAVGSGNAPVLIQGGKYLVGASPIPARVVNALVTVE